MAAQGRCPGQNAAYRLTQALLRSGERRVQSTPVSDKLIETIVNQEDIHSEQVSCDNHRLPGASTG
jgi:hypothetical protein